MRAYSVKFASVDSIPIPEMFPEKLILTVCKNTNIIKSTEMEKSQIGFFSEKFIFEHKANPSTLQEK